MSIAKKALVAGGVILLLKARVPQVNRAALAAKRLVLTRPHALRSAWERMRRDPAYRPGNLRGELDPIAAERRRLADAQAAQAGRVQRRGRMTPERTPP